MISEVSSQDLQIGLKFRNLDCVFESLFLPIYVEL